MLSGWLSSTTSWNGACARMRRSSGRLRWWKSPLPSMTVPSWAGSGASTSAVKRSSVALLQAKRSGSCHCGRARVCAWGSGSTPPSRSRISGERNGIVQPPPSGSPCRCGASLRRAARSSGERAWIA
ncbi:hypothetical protein G6F59_017651 [Rhizopus arrhizus]|nr:hypothetical protein G6F59_017651 [Rhizopus arrhizus]